MKIFSLCKNRRLSVVSFLLPSLCLVVLAGTLLFSWHLAFADGTPTFPKQDCATVQSPTAQLCNNQDPIDAGCAADAQTAHSVPIVFNTRVIGRLDLRYSKQCNSYWARVVSSIGGDIAQVLITSPLDLFYQSKTNEAYSNMVFSVQPTIAGRLIIPAQGAAPGARYP